MGEFQTVLAVIVSNAAVLGVVLLALYLFNNDVKQCGR